MIDKNESAQGVSTQTQRVSDTNLKKNYSYLKRSPENSLSLLSLSSLPPPLLSQAHSHSNEKGRSPPRLRLHPQGEGKMEEGKVPSLSLAELRKEDRLRSACESNGVEYFPPGAAERQAMEREIERRRKQLERKRASPQKKQKQQRLDSQRKQQERQHESPQKKQKRNQRNKVHMQQELWKGGSAAHFLGAIWRENGVDRNSGPDGGMERSSASPR